MINRWIVAATVLAAAVAYPATANAMPKGGGSGGWDIEYYDQCMREGQWSAEQCCVQSGGHWSPSFFHYGEGTCSSPPANRL